MENEINELCDEIIRLRDSREREGDRLDWLLFKLSGDAIRAAVGELSSTSDVAEWRAAIDKAMYARIEQGEEE